jgi:hypothetical protein
MQLSVQKELSANRPGKPNGKGRQVAPPPTEPAGRAPKGEAYQA